MVYIFWSNLFFIRYYVLCPCVPKKTNQSPSLCDVIYECSLTCSLISGKEYNQQSQNFLASHQTSGQGPTKKKFSSNPLENMDCKFLLVAKPGKHVLWASYTSWCHLEIPGVTWDPKTWVKLILLCIGCSSIMQLITTCVCVWTCQ